jgi:hypothetical protein
MDGLSITGLLATGRGLLMPIPMSGGVPIRLVRDRKRADTRAIDCGASLMTEEQAAVNAEALGISMGITFYVVRNPEGD